MVDTTKKAGEKEAPTSKVYTYGRTRKAADTKIVVNDHLIKEDEFAGYYLNKGNQVGMLIEPPYNLSTLANLVTRNNILSQCVDTMEVNIDGTGHTIEAFDANIKGNEADKARLENFFNEPYPGVSFLSMRRNVRWDLEATGNGYLEVMPNIAGETIFLRYVDATMLRLVKLGEPVLVTKKVIRGGQEFEADIWVRERIFATIVGAKLQYYKEHGSKRLLNRETGQWEKEGTVLPVTKIASELIHFTVNKDVRSAYGIPRWINQLPSVLGSRKAEEFNLEFFDNGGVPPAAIFIQGGSLGSDVRKQLDGYFGGGAKGKHRVAIVEVQSNSGSLDSAGSVQVKTERFGDSRTSDSMFQMYDKNTEEHVRVGFRIPPIFLGRANDYNFASAITSYMVAEAQVFQPERQEFDEIINQKIVKSFGITDWFFHSKPITLTNVDVQLKALDLVKEKIKPEQLVDTINELAMLNLDYDGTTDQLNMDIKKLALTPPPEAATINPPPASGNNARDNVVPIRARQAVAKQANETLSMQWLVHDWLIASGVESGDLAGNSVQDTLDTVTNLTKSDREEFQKVLALNMFGTEDKDMQLIANCCANAVSEEHDH